MKTSDIIDEVSDDTDDSSSEIIPIDNYFYGSSFEAHEYDDDYLLTPSKAKEGEK